MHPSSAGRADRAAAGGGMVQVGGARAALLGLLLLLAVVSHASCSSSCSMGDQCRVSSCPRCPGVNRCLKSDSQARYCVPLQRQSIPAPDYSRPYNRNAFLVTHNSYAHSGSWSFWSANQRRSLEEQLAEGVRGFMLDLHSHQGDVFLCHGSCSSNVLPGAALQSLESVLTMLRRHLQRHRHEVLTLFIESYVPDRAFLDALIGSGIAPFVYAKRRWPGVGQEWPALRDMAPAVVIFGQGDWDYLKETMYGTVSSSTCDQRPESRDRGTDRRNLLLVNHFQVFFGRYNSFPTLKEKLTTCRRSQGQLANFLAVDFYDNGDSLGGAKMAVRWLDAQWAATSAQTGNSVSRP